MNPEPGAHPAPEHVVRRETRGNPGKPEDHRGSPSKAEESGATPAAAAAGFTLNALRRAGFMLEASRCVWDNTPFHLGHKIEAEPRNLQWSYAWCRVHTRCVPPCATCATCVGRWRLCCLTRLCVLRQIVNHAMVCQGVWDWSSRETNPLAPNPGVTLFEVPSTRFWIHSACCSWEASSNSYIEPLQILYLVQISYTSIHKSNVSSEVKICNTKRFFNCAAKDRTNGDTEDLSNTISLAAASFSVRSQFCARGVTFGAKATRGERALVFPEELREGSLSGNHNTERKSTGSRGFLQAESRSGRGIQHGCGPGKGNLQ